MVDRRVISKLQKNILLKIGSIILSTSLCIFTIFTVTFVFQNVYAQTLPTITSVSDIIPNQHQTITITGSGFGNQMPYTNQDSPYIKITDRTSNWNAGNSPNPTDGVTLDVSSWSDSQIVITGFEGSYGNNNWTLNYGDTIDIYVWNAGTTNGQPTTYTATVTMDRNTVPTFDFKAPTISGLAVSLTGKINNPNGNPDKSIIEWGDGTSSINYQNGQQIPNSWIHTYSKSGTYVIKVTATDINGLSGSTTQTVNLQQQGQSTQTNQNSFPPSVEMNSPVIHGLVVNLKGNIVAQTTGASINWNQSTIDWGDGTKTLTSQYTHTYSQAGTYTITITAYDSNNLSTTMHEGITLIAPMLSHTFTTHTLSDQSSCQAFPFNGTWDGSTLTCSISGLELKSGNTIAISSGVNLNNSGTFASVGNVTNSGTINNNSGGEIGVAHYFTNSGTINNNSGGEIGGSLSNSGTINNNSGGEIGSYITNSGTINNNSGGNIDGSLSNSGTINNNFGGTIINTAGMTSTYMPNSSVASSSTMNNVAGITNTISGTINNSGNITNNRVSAINNYEIGNAEEGIIINYGIINNSGGTININIGDLLNLGTIRQLGYIKTGNYGGDSLGIIYNNFGGMICGDITNAYVTTSSHVKGVITPTCNVIPEFPFAVPILLVSFVSVIAFYRIRKSTIL